MCDLVYILKIHCYISVYSDRTAVSCKVDSFVSVLPDDYRFVVAFQFWNSPSHAQEAINLIKIFADFFKQIFLYYERFIITNIHRLCELNFINHTFQSFYRFFKCLICCLCFCLNSHVFFVTCTTWAFPEVCMCQTSDQWSYYEFYIHCFLFHD